MKEKKYLMEFDRTLVKSWFCVLPLESLPEFIKEFSSDFLVTLQGVFYRLESAGLSWDDAKVRVVALSRLTAGGWWVAGQGTELNIELKGKRVALK